MPRGPERQDIVASGVNDAHQQGDESCPLIPAPREQSPIACGQARFAPVQNALINPMRSEAWPNNKPVGRFKTDRQQQLSQSQPGGHGGAQSGSN